MFIDITIFPWVAYVLFALNITLASTVIFLERRDPSATWAWLMVLFFIPLIGFIFYLVFGQNLSKHRLFDWDDKKKIGIEEQIQHQKKAIKAGVYPFANPRTQKNAKLVYMLLSHNDAVLSEDNQVRIFTDGEEKFSSLMKDISEAKNHIHIQYYVFRMDGLGQKLVNLLTEKARSGVEVCLLYDDMGSRMLSPKHFKSLTQAGGVAETFFPSSLPFINLRLNYRNHRKIVVIDGQIGYVGGFNVGDEYLGKNPSFGYWRDTHLRIEGSAVHPLQTRFILDWNQASKRHDFLYEERLFPKPKTTGDAAMQIVTSGPDSEWEQIKSGYLKLIATAKNSIYIQTPYFIPDASILDALQIAALSGVDVKIMIPNKPDHPFVYWATYSYAGELMKAGAKIYIYNNGFIHAKTIVVDEELSSVGTANIDVRSSRLNFEVNAFMYDYEAGKRLAQIFRNDMEVSFELTPELYLQRSNLIKFKESISRLLSPIL